jgi:hypothetical protein
VFLPKFGRYMQNIDENGWLLSQVRSLCTCIEATEWRPNSTGVVDSASSERAADGHGPQEGAHEVAQSQRHHLLCGVQ